MSVIQELIRTEADNTISFGNYLMDEKKKVSDFELDGDLYKVKTFCEITKLEKNGILLYESIPGTTVHNFNMDEKNVKFGIETKKDAQLTLELEPEKSYKIYIDQVQVDKVKTNLSGKITFSVDSKSEEVKIEKV